MKLRTLSCFAAVLCLFSPAFADVNITGWVSPSDPTDWLNSTQSVSIGRCDSAETAYGQVDIDGGSQVSSLGVSFGSAGAMEFRSHGVANVSGQGTVWNNTGMSVGLSNELISSKGTLNISTGAKVYSGNVSMGGSASRINIDGNGSLLQASGLTLGYEDAWSNQISVTNGGHIIAGNTSMGVFYETSTFISIDGAQSYFEHGELNMTNSDFSVTNGAVSQGTFLACDNYSNVNIIGNGSSYTTGDIRMYDAYIRVSEGARLKANDIDVHSVTGIRISGAGSVLECDSLDLTADMFDIAGVTIRDGALVVVHDYIAATWSDLRLYSGAMLAFEGNGEASIDEFFSLINVSGGISFYDEDSDSNILFTDGTYGEDYILDYHEDGQWAGYTFLTVPEPASFLILLAGMACAVSKKCRI